MAVGIVVSDPMPCLFGGARPNMGAAVTAADGGDSAVTMLVGGAMALITIYHSLDG